MTIDDPEILQFTHLLMEAKSKYSPNIKPYLRTHDIIDSVDGFSHIALNYNLLPPIKIKTKPSIFIMKRKSSVKYDTNNNNNAKSLFSLKDFLEQDDTGNIELKLSHEKARIMELISEEIAESLEEFQGPEAISRDDFSDVDTDKIDEPFHYAAEEIKRLDDTNDADVTSAENITEINNVNESLITGLQDKKERESDHQKNFKDATGTNDESDEKRDETKIEKGNLIKGKSRNNLNLRQENHGVKGMVKKILQEKMLEVKQRKEINQEREIMQRIINSMMEMKTETTDEAKITKRAYEESTDHTDKSKESVKDDGKQKVVRTRNVTWKADKIKIKKPAVSEQAAKDERVTVESLPVHKITVDATVMKNAKVRDRTNMESSNAKPINVRESIRNIINQFKEFEKDFIRDDTDSTIDSMEEEPLVKTDDAIMAHPAETEGQTVIKDPKESLKEILDQFKHIKHELTFEGDDQFDEITANYLDRPIAETLLKFSEALKSLMQRRKMIPSHKRENDLPDDDSRQATMLEKQEDFMTVETGQATTTHESGMKLVDENEEKNSEAKLKPAKPKSKDKRDGDIANEPIHDPTNVLSDASKYVDVSTTTADASLDAQQRYNDDILNNVNKADITKGQTSRKNGPK